MDARPKLELISATLAIAMLLSSANVVAAALETVWTDPSQLNFNVRTAPLFVDLDGDGTMEIVVGTYGSLDKNEHVQSALSVYGRNPDGTIGLRLNRAVDKIMYGMAAVPGAHGSGILITSSWWGVSTLTEFEGPDLLQVRHANLDQARAVVAVADVDADGTLDVLLAPPLGASAPEVRLIDYTTLAKKWEDPGISRTVSVHQLDADAALEVIVRGPPGRVLDGMTGARKFVWPDGFGYGTAFGRFESDPSILGWATSTERLTFFRAAPYSPTRELPLHQSHLTAFDVDGDLREELYALGAAGSNLARISVVDGSAEILTPVTAVNLPPRIGRLLPTEGPLVVVEGLVNPGGLRSMRLFDLDTGEDRFSAPFIGGPRSATGYFQHEAGADSVIVELTNSMTEFGRQMSVAVRDPDNGAVVSSQPLFDGGSGYFSPRLMVADVDGDGGDELIAIDPSSFARVALLEGNDFALRWQQQSGLGPLGNNQIQAWGLVDWNGDGNEDVALVIRDGLIGRTFALVLSGVDGTELWRSVLLLADEFASAGLVARIAPSSAPELVIGLSGGLHGFTPDSIEPSWSFEAQTGETFVDVVSWGSGQDCRLGVRLAGSDLLTLGCDDRLPRGRIELPDETDWLAPLDREGNALAAHANGGLWLALDGQPFRMELDGLGVGLRANWPWGMRYAEGATEFLLGSPLELRRVRLSGDAIFDSGFEPLP